MWTPRHVVVMIAGLAVFLVGFGVYGHFLGGIDGLTPLPENYWPDQSGAPFSLPPPRPNDLENKIRMAFGEPSAELKRIIRLEIPSRHLVLAADDFQILKEGERKGQVLLAPLSIAVFGKGPYPEINTVQCDEAYLTFDREISTPDQMGKSKIVAGELVSYGNLNWDQFKGNWKRYKGKVKDKWGKLTDDDLDAIAGKKDELIDKLQKEYLYKEDKAEKEVDEFCRTGYFVVITNNRRTPQRDDDLYLRTQGPVFYQESFHRIWTDNVVWLEDMHSQPEPTMISGIGMDLLLTSETEPAKAAPAHKAKSENLSGVDHINLRSSVKMRLFVDPQSGFLASEKPAGPGVKPAPQPAPNKDRVDISTEGPFSYEVAKDRAKFEISHRRSTLPSRVQVTREHQNSPLKDKPKDRLDCDQLELQFKRKNANGQQPGNVAAEDRSLDLEIESAHASQLYQAVELASEAQGLNASSHDLYYDARTRQTLLKGDPLVHVMKDANEIVAREVLLTGIDKRETQQVTAKGPGVIHMLDKTTLRHTLHARWKDLLTSTKDGPYDCLILTGDAAFEDEAHGQKLQAQKIKLWLEPSEGNNNRAPDQQQRLRPHHLEAYGGVRIESPELQVVEPMETLLIWFEDSVSPPDARVPGIGQKAGAQIKPAPTTAPVNPADKPKKPLRLSARAGKAHVSRAGNRNDLKTLECIGTVRVLQDPAGPDDKGVDIRGDTLQLNHHADGNVLVVTGNSQNLAQVQLNKVTIHGHEVQIDQVINRAKVDGAGDMLMLTTTDFEGNKLVKPTELTIQWDKAMQFDGKHADFSGGIQAQQNDSRLLCQEMQVDLDRPVSFKEGEPNRQPAKVERLVCDKRRTNKPVFIEDHTWQGARLIRYQRMLAPEVSVDNGKVIASGPGIVSLLQLGTAEDDPLAADPPRKGGTPPANPVKQVKQELKLTRITYQGRMDGDNVRRIANFFDQVEVIYGPADDPDIKVDPASPPPRFMVLDCQEKLAVYSHLLPNGQKSQEMEACGKVRVHAQEFWGNAQTITYDENKQEVVLRGTKENPAHLYRVWTKGAEPEPIAGRTIYYWRKTRSYRVVDGDRIGISIRNGGKER